MFKLLFPTKYGVKSSEYFDSFIDIYRYLNISFFFSIKVDNKLVK